MNNQEYKPLPKTSSTDFCKAFVERELITYKENKIWMSYWPIMERMIESSSELSNVYKELIDRFDYTDKFEGTHPENTYIWLILEHIWMSWDFNKETIKKTKMELNKLLEIQQKIINLSQDLAIAIKEQNQLYDCSDFIRPGFQTVLDLIELSGKTNDLYELYVSDEINKLGKQYDYRYWPSRENLVQSIADYEQGLSIPGHMFLPEDILNGKTSYIKDFVIAFDRKFDEINSLPDAFRFSNNAMADIINFIVDMPKDLFATPEAVRIVRHRYSLNNANL